MSEAHPPHQVGEPPISELVEDALHDVTELVRAEFSLAAQEFKKEATMAVGAAAAWAATAAFSTIALTLLIPAVLLGAGVRWPMALLGTAGIFAALAMAAFLLARRLMPARILGRTRDRVARDVQQIEDHAS